ncbi:unnamed protein product [Urochloa humidicola]
MDVNFFNTRYSSTQSTQADRCAPDLSSVEAHLWFTISGGSVPIRITMLICHPVLRLHVVLPAQASTASSSRSWTSSSLPRLAARPSSRRCCRGVAPPRRPGPLPPPPATRPTPTSPTTGTLLPSPTRSRPRPLPPVAPEPVGAAFPPAGRRRRGGLALHPKHDAAPPPPPATVEPAAGALGWQQPMGKGSSSSTPV